MYTVLYICDGKACKEGCSYPLCKYTQDINHAKNFKRMLNCPHTKMTTYYEDDAEKGPEPYMTPNEYQKLAMRTCCIPYENTDDMIRHAVFGLSSEAGEVAGILQKVYQGHEIDLEHMKKELGDCLWMIAEACTAYGFDMEDVMETNINKLKKRFPEGFDTEHSLHRAEGDI